MRLGEACGASVSRVHRECYIVIGDRYRFDACNGVQWHAFGVYFRFVDNVDILKPSNHAFQRS